MALHVAGIWFITSALGVPVAAQTPSLKVTEWASKSGPLLVRSGIIEGPTEIGLVDTQFSNANTHRLIANLIETGKPLRWVYVTHPHVDHFNGATLLRAAFPNAKFYDRYPIVRTDGGRATGGTWRCRARWLTERNRACT